MIHAVMPIKARAASAALAFCLAGGVAATDAKADEGGVSFWLPGLFGSLAAVPQQPGFSIASIYYHTSVDADPHRAFVRGGAISLGLKADADIMIAIPSYAFQTPVLGGQLVIGMMSIFGGMNASATATLTGPDRRRAVGRPRRFRHRLRRSLSASLAALEPRHEQFHDLRHRRRAGRHL